MDYKELCCKIIDSHDGLVYVTDMETNEVIFVNKKLLQVIGKNKAEVLGNRVIKLCRIRNVPANFALTAYFQKINIMTGRFFARICSGILFCTISC